MRNFFLKLWRVVTFPFRLVLQHHRLPFRKIRQFNQFLNTEPEEHPLGEVFVDLTTKRGYTPDDVGSGGSTFASICLRALLVLILMVCVSFFFTQRVVDFLAIPIGGLDALTAIDPTESIGVFMKVAIFSGIALSIPYIAFEMWLFAAPGLRPDERKMGLAGNPAGIHFLHRRRGVYILYHAARSHAFPDRVHEHQNPIAPAIVLFLRHRPDVLDWVVI